MKHSQLEILANLISDADNSAIVSLGNDSLTLKFKKNEIYIATAVIGIFFACVLLFFYQRATINLELGLFILILSFFILVQKQAINKTLVFSEKDKTITIIPTFFINRWFLKSIIKLKQSVSLDELNEIKFGYALINNQSNWNIYFNKGLWAIVLFRFTNKEKSKAICHALNEIRL